MIRLQHFVIIKLRNGRLSKLTKLHALTIYIFISVCKNKMHKVYRNSIYFVVVYFKSEKVLVSAHS